MYIYAVAPKIQLNYRKSIHILQNSFFFNTRLFV